jgi:hypothetical protein
VGPVGEHVTGRSDFAVLHGMPLGYGVYIPLREFAKSESLFREIIGPQLERLIAGQ